MRVFVVDDDAAIADTLSAILQSAGFSARAFYDGDMALRAAGEEPPGFVIGDVVMPGMDGLELAAQLRKQCPDCPILLVSGNANLRALVEQRGGNAGFEILNKPVHPSVLIERVRAAQGRAGV